MELNRRKSFGQAMSEYALPVALIALISIPALIQVSSNLGDFSKTTWRTIKGDPGRATGAAPADTETLIESLMTGRDLGPYQVTYKNGRFTYTLPPSLGGGTHTTGSIGDLNKIAASVFRNFGRKADLPGDLGSEFMQLGDMVTRLDAEERWMNAHRYDNPPPSYWPLIAEYEGFANQYRDMMDEVRMYEAQGHDMTEAREVLKGYAGIISYNAYANYIYVVDSDYGNSGYDYGDRGGTGNSGLVGYPPRDTLSASQTPGATRDGIGAINDL